MSSRRIAVTFLHGVEISDKGYASTATRLLRESFSRHAGVDADDGLVIEPAFWAPVLQDRQDQLFDRTFGASSEGFFRLLTGLVTRVGAGSGAALLLTAGTALLPRIPFVSGRLTFPTLRWVVTQLLGDAVAYQPSDGDRTIYCQVHAEIAAALRLLAEQAGPDAPLCVIAHSLGTVIASNYFYDLQVCHREGGRRNLAGPVRARMGDTALERGETLALLYTLGSPIALWTVGYNEFGIPLQVPAPDLARHHPELDGEWVNFYDRDDVVAFPLQGLSPAYHDQVVDRQVSVGPWWARTTPLAHPWYWNDRKVIDVIGRSLAVAWLRLNPGHGAGTGYDLDGADRVPLPVEGVRHPVRGQPGYAVPVTDQKPIVEAAEMSGPVGP